MTGLESWRLMKLRNCFNAKKAYIRVTLLIGMKYALLLSLFITSSFAYAQFGIGHATLTFNDPARSGGYGSGGGAGRQIQTEIYYPGTTAGENVPVLADSFPIIVFGHGFAMSWDAYSNIWEHYVPLGYIVAFPRTEGSLFPSPSHADFGLDLALVSTKMNDLNSNSQSPFFQRLNGNTAIMGHSMGGGASMLAAGNSTSIRTVVGLAPAETNPSAIAASANVSVPALIFSGSEDGVTPPNDHHVPIYNALGSGCKSFASIVGGGHCYFANTNFNCDFGEATSSGGITITRAEQQARVFAILDPWLAFSLKMDCNAYELFQQALAANPSLVVGSTTCSVNTTPQITQQGSLLTCSVPGYNYQWYLDGIAIPSATNQTLNCTVNGAYTVEVVFNTGCSEISDQYLLFDLGITENKRVVMVYPNPFNETLMVSGVDEGVQFQIVQPDGKCVMQGQLNGLLNMRDFASGTYFLHVQNTWVKLTK